MGKETFSEQHVFDYLEKKGKSNLMWKQRYWVLKGFCLTYYHDCSQGIEKGRIELANTEFKVINDAGSKEFQIEILGRSYYLRAKTIKQTQKWVHALEAIQRM